MKHKTLNHIDSFNIILNKLKKNEIFTYVRFGDGDFIMMYEDSINKTIGQSNRFIVNKNLQQELIESYNINDKNYLIGTTINDFTEHSTHNNININKLKMLIEKDELLSAICLQEIFLKHINIFKNFIKELNKSSTMFICNYKNDKLSNYYGKIKHFITVPKQNSYSNIDLWYDKILENINDVDKLILSSGQSSRIIAKRLYKDNIKKTIIDVGSLSDMLIADTQIINNIPIRSHIKNNFQKILNNLKYLKNNN